MTLEDSLKERIRAQGPVPLETVMGEAVEAYYAQGTAFGQEGDFTTAPEICQVFGELVGLWAAVSWQMLGQPQPLRLVELGPGRGTLMADALRAARKVVPFAESLDLHLIERSPALRQRQKEALAGHAVHWHDDLSTVPDGPMIVIANEFFDALPVRQWERGADGWHLRQVGLEEESDSLIFTPGPLAEAGEDLPEEARLGTLVERCPTAEAIATRLGQRLSQGGGGMALIFDYGYWERAEEENTSGDTVQAVRGHRFQPVLQNLGTADLTAHVDFSRLAAAARAGGAESHGPIGQGRFLSALGIEQRVRDLMKAATPEQAFHLSSGVHRLIHPTEMGTLFKVLALTTPGFPPPPGFEALRRTTATPGA